MSEPDILQRAKAKLNSEHFAFWFVLAPLPQISLLPIFTFECIFFKVCLFHVSVSHYLLFFLRERKRYQEDKKVGGTRRNYRREKIKIYDFFMKIGYKLRLHWL